MGLFRLLFWIALIAIAFWLWRRFTRPTPHQQQRPQDEPSASPMVRCAHCGVHVPQANALTHEQRWYCSQAHLRQDQDDRAR
ncbi:TPA: PP0621 family protein [Pseudomonas aeruginosa]|uniref:PP0621 family protein n=1 Tax=Pseudomonas aeruginosa TaxID=287 RepID=UPI00330739F6|nr:hypothetical protein [Pseudomonas aeruginosa]HBO5325541.1 hypothetical protein [Pseudomonas aeruginosa]HCR1768551.1 hypothetical protein [Pseudomonas aeruginosa]